MRYHLIDILRGTRIISYYKQFCSMPYTADELKNLQCRKLAAFLILLRHENPFYSQFLQNIDESQIRLFPENVLRLLPLADKRFINKNIDKLFSPKPGRKYQSKHTGGSTGEPFHYYIDLTAVSESWAYILWCWHKYVGYKPGEPYMTVAGASLSAQGQKLKVKIYQLLQNSYFINADVISTDIQVKKKAVVKSRLLFGYPNAILSLLEMKPSLFDGHRLRAVFCTSEQLTLNVRRSLEEVLKVPVYDLYGANDGGLISCECKIHCGFHYDPLNCYVEEYINEDGESELLLTGLNSLTLPFVRYRVGDVATLGEFGSCPCGNPFPMIRNLKGRSRDLIRLHNGQAVHGVLFNKIFYPFQEVQRYRIIQTDDYRVSVQLEIKEFQAWYASERRNDLEHQLSDLLKDTTFFIEELQPGSWKKGKFRLIESDVC